jgi:hypothetical protein
MTTQTISDTQEQFLELIRCGATTPEATRAVGYSRGIVWHWAKANPMFAARLNALRPSVAKSHAIKSTPNQPVLAKAPTLSLHELAMQRLERELRTDGPNAVLAAAAIALTATQDIATLTPDAVAETPVVSETFELFTMQNETPSMALHRMMSEVFPLNAPCTYQVDTGHAREHLERFYDCNLEVELRTNAKSIANILRYYLSERFPVAFETHQSSHSARIYAVPQPKTRI